MKFKVATFQFLFFWLSPSDIEMNFLPKYVHCNRLKLSGVLEEFSITSQFLGSKMQKSTY